MITQQLKPWDSETAAINQQRNLQESASDFNTKSADVAKTRTAIFQTTPSAIYSLTEEDMQRVKAITVNSNDSRFQMFLNVQGYFRDTYTNKFTSQLLRVGIIQYLTQWIRWFPTTPLRLIYLIAWLDLLVINFRIYPITQIFQLLLLRRNQQLLQLRLVLSHPQTLSHPQFPQLQRIWVSEMFIVSNCIPFEILSIFHLPK